MERSLLPAMALLAVSLAGCIGDDAAPPAAAPGSGPNLWEAGLSETHPTPASVVVTRSDADRRSALAPPGDPAFASLDATIEGWMEAHGVPAGALAVMKDGKLRYERGYGHLDPEATRPADEAPLMRIASLGKLMVARVVGMMVEEGRLDWDDPVFCVPPQPRGGCILPLEPHPARPVVDRRLADVRLAHLRDHEAGFATFGPCNDALWGDGAIAAARALGAPAPLPPWRMVQWLMGARLAYEPGSEAQYCNAGYVTLGVVAEAITGATLAAVLDAYLFRPLEVAGDIAPGRSLPADRDPREPFYACDANQGSRTTRSVHDPGQEVCWPDGGFPVETQLASGGLVATPAAVVAVVESVPLRPGVVLPWYFAGSQPGTRAYTDVLDDGGAVHGKLQYALVFNTQECAKATVECDTASLREAVLQQLRAWGAAEALPTVVPG